MLKRPFRCGIMAHHVRPPFPLLGMIHWQCRWCVVPLDIMFLPSSLKVFSGAKSREFGFGTSLY